MNWIGLPSERQFDCDQPEKRGMLPNEATGQYRQQIGVRKVSQRHHKRWHGQDDTAPASALCQHLVHEAMRITVERHQEMLRCTERSLSRSAGEWMTLAHRDHEVFLVEPARFETGRNLVDWQHCEIDLSVLKHHQASGPERLLRFSAPLRHDLDEAGVDMRRLGADALQ